MYQTSKRKGFFFLGALPFSRVLSNFSLVFTLLVGRGKRKVIVSSISEFHFLNMAPYEAGYIDVDQTLASMHKVPTP